MLPERPDWDYVIDHVLTRISMFTKPTYESAVAFVEGFDFARGDEVHPLMQAWAVERFGKTNLGWPLILAHLVLHVPHYVPGPGTGPFPQEVDRAAIALLRQALREVTSSTT
ncbi:hypothetical protein [Rudaeicoccus suwonensis]|uniref:hypothetical protein n=1 Tax=Rudaeicoccus suwonensis TaxID=657409 RepID=UPI00119D8EAC|nr:hypothetical protein [Rudaeicoccus suwonensis]